VDGDEVDTAADVAGLQFLDKPRPVNGQPFQVQADDVDVVDVAAIRVGDGRLDLGQVGEGLVVEAGVARGPSQCLMRSGRCADRRCRS
jgi:hypothetical protein